MRGARLAALCPLVARLALTATADSPAGPASAPASTCLGTPARGALRGGVPLPWAGANFEAYAALARERPSTVYVFGETGWCEGDLFVPHRTHQNGLSVDFMVPTVDEAGRSRPLPCHPFNTFGYGVELDRRGRLGALRLDTEAMTAHLLALDRAARAHGARLRLVIFDSALQPLLHRTRAWPVLRQRVRFSTRPAWICHDEHYRVDFALPCQPLP